jgi:ABC-type oligopeptide transport system ATPase subunit
MTVLAVAHLRKTFRQRRAFARSAIHTAVDDVSFEISPGTTLAVVGESGAGKSTVARLVMRLIDADDGTVHLDGVNLTSIRGRALRVHRRSMQMIFQDPYSSLDPRFTIGRSVAEPLRVHFGMNRSDCERVATELLSRVGLDRHYVSRIPRQLSGGQLQRVSIARALALKPLLIVCDEAVAALDVSIRAQVLNLLSDIQEETRIAYLFIAHDLTIVEAFADEVVVMKDGRVVEAAPAKTLFRAPSHPYTRELLAAVPVADPAARTLTASPRNSPLGGQTK